MVFTPLKNIFGGKKDDKKMAGSVPESVLKKQATQAKIAVEAKQASYDARQKKRQDKKAEWDKQREEKAQNQKGEQYALYFCLSSDGLLVGIGSRSMSPMCPAASDPPPHVTRLARLRITSAVSLFLTAREDRRREPTRSDTRVGRDSYKPSRR